MEIAATSRTRGGLGRLLLLGGFVAASASAAILFLFDPAASSFYPRCMFHSVTGLDCPGCGGLRATHQLLHGNVAAAFALNPLLVGLAPVAGWFGLRHLVLKFTGRPLPQPFRNPNWVWALGAVVIGFGVLRNLPLRAWLGV